MPKLEIYLEKIYMKMNKNLFIKLKFIEPIGGFSLYFRHCTAPWVVNKCKQNTNPQMKSLRQSKSSLLVLKWALKVSRS